MKTQIIVKHFLLNIQLLKTKMKTKMKIIIKMIMKMKMRIKMEIKRKIIFNLVKKQKFQRAKNYKKLLTIMQKMKYKEEWIFTAHSFVQILKCFIGLFYILIQSNSI